LQRSLTVDRSYHGSLNVRLITPKPPFQLRGRRTCVRWLTAVPHKISTQPLQCTELSNYSVATLRNSSARDKRQNDRNNDDAYEKPTNSLCKVLGQAHDSRPRGAADARPRMLGQLPVVQAHHHRPAPRGSLKNDHEQYRHLQRHR